MLLLILGNSGGALVNSKGQVIGINTLKFAGNGVEGMGFAIPINATKDIYQELKDYSKVKRPYIGISGTDITDQLSKTYNLPIGIYVKTIENFSPAEKSGLQVADVIIEINETKITTMDELNAIKNKLKIGDEITLKIKREGNDKDIKLTLGEQP